MFYLYVDVYTNGYIKCKSVSTGHSKIDKFDYDLGKKKFGKHQVQIIFDKRYCERFGMLIKLGTFMPDDDKCLIILKEGINDIIDNIDSTNDIKCRIDNHEDILRILHKIISYPDESLMNIMNSDPIVKQVNFGYRSRLMTTIFNKLHEMTDNTLKKGTIIERALSAIREYKLDPEINRFPKITCTYCGAKLSDTELYADDNSKISSILGVRSIKCPCCNHELRFITDLHPIYTMEGPKGAPDMNGYIYGLDQHQNQYCKLMIR